MKKIISFLLIFSLLIPTALAYSESEILDVCDSAAIDPDSFLTQQAVLTGSDISIEAPCAILMEKQTGTVIYEKNADEQMSPASVTKIMTILLIVEAIENNKISLDDMVSVSTHAASMGGSQVYLKEGEQMSVHEMLKSIVVSSANDAAVAMSEFIAGTEESFVNMMNQRAHELGMINTNFTNCSGLIDDPSHLTSARDIAIMSRELIRHEMIKAYTTIWMDTIRDGEFGLSNTNKLIYYYEGATGLKTGFTSEAMYCLSATAERNGVEYIAVVLHGQTSQQRFEDAKTLLNYGFANYTLISNTPDEAVAPIPVKLGQTDCIQPVLEQDQTILIDKNSASNVTKTVELTPELTAPVAQGDVVGTITVTSGDEVIGKYNLVADQSVEKVTWFNIFARFLKSIYASCG